MALARSPAEQVLAEERGEDVREASEVREHRLEATSAETGLSEAVVGRAPLGVREHLVRLRDLPEPELGVRLAGHVGVELARERPERPLDVRIARVPGNAEQLVVVALGRRHGTGQTSS